MSGNGHPHVVFHRSAVRNGTDAADKKAPQKKRRKKRRRRHHSNCGTKEPRRSAEQKIEWQPQGKVNLIPRKLHKLGLSLFRRNLQKTWFASPGTRRLRPTLCVPGLFHDLHTFSPPLSLFPSASCYLLVLLNKKTNFQRALL